MIFSNYENVQHRDDRLKKCARIAASLFSISDDQLSALVHKLHDHKGELTVVWAHKPTERGRLVLEEAWGQCAEYNTEHWWPGLTEEYPTFAFRR